MTRSQKTGDRISRYNESHQHPLNRAWRLACIPIVAAGHVTCPDRRCA
jgi:hypothetical protein